MVHARSDASETFATSRAPYIEYLAGIKGSWNGAATFEEEIRTLAREVKRHDTGTSSGSLVTIAEILDIRSGPDGKMCISNGRATLKARLESTMPEVAAAGNFLHQLNDCEPDVHTRIVVLNSERTNIGQAAADDLLFCHILGVELDLPLMDVQIISQVGDLSDETWPLARWPYCRPLKPGFVSLGPFATISQRRSVAAYIGRRSLSRSAPHVVVIHLQDFPFVQRHSGWASVGSLWEPPVKSQWSSYARTGVSEPTSFLLFSQAFKHSLATTGTLGDDEMTGTWLSSLVYMDAIINAETLNALALRRRPHATPKVEDANDILMQARQTCASLQASVEQVAAFGRSHPSTRPSDYHNAQEFLERLLDDARTLAKDIKESFNTEHQLQNMQVSRLAVKETRSAIALTILAFIFIPINLASSLYGMNVQEINETGHSIWIFVVTAMALLACSGFGWVFWRG